MQQYLEAAVTLEAPSVTAQKSLSFHSAPISLSRALLMVSAMRSHVWPFKGLCHELQENKKAMHLDSLLSPSECAQRAAQEREVSYADQRSVP